MASEFTPKALIFLAGVASAAFGSGATFMAWESTHPTAVEIATALGCATYLDGSGAPALSHCPAATDARAARAETMRLAGEIQRMRPDVVLGVGRVSAAKRPGRDAAGKAALRMYEGEVRSGVPPEQAMVHVLETDF